MKKQVVKKRKRQARKLLGTGMAGRAADAIKKRQRRRRKILESL